MAPVKKRILRKPSAKEPEASTILKVYDVSVDLMDDSPENPQEMDDSTFDELVEGIRTEGFNEPIHVIKQFDGKGEWNGRYMVVSGHHRKKAAIVCGMEKIPTIIREDMSDLSRKIALVRANQLRGKMNPLKFKELFDDIAKQQDQELVKRMMGFTSKDAFKQVYKEASKGLPKEQRKKLEKAEETIRSVDDLSSVLNRIFREEGSQVERGHVVFSFGGKEHHYFQIGSSTNKVFKRIAEYMSEHDIDSDTMISSLISGFDEATFRVKNSKRVRKGDDE